MGGFGSGRYGGRPTVDVSLRVDLALMIRKGWISDGCKGAGSLNWSRGGEPTASISYRYNMFDPDDASLTLSYRQQRQGEDWTDRQQTIRLAYTVPPFGGRRWWMVCPVRGNRAGKLYLPPGGDIFAGRLAWRLGYQSQRIAHRDRPFEALFRLQSKLGSDTGWEQPIRRPKGMWRRTFERHEQRYWELDNQCAMEMMALVGRLGRPL